MKDFVVTEQPGYIASQRCNVKPPNSRSRCLPIEGTFSSAVKVHMGNGLELCIPLKIKKFQKMVVKIALQMPRP